MKTEIDFAKYVKGYFRKDLIDLVKLITREDHFSSYKQIE